MKREPVDEQGRAWILGRAAAFRRTEYRREKRWEEWPWFTATEIARNFEKSKNGHPLTRHQVAYLIEKHDPKLWHDRVVGRGGSLEDDDA